MDNIAELRAVEKSFGDVRAVSEVSLPVPRGAIMGLLGPSGSGKTSLIRLLLGVLTPDRGQVEVFGRDPRKLTARDRERLGYSPQLLYLYPALSVSETMSFYASTYGLPWFRGRRRRIPGLLAEVDLLEAKNRLVGSLSGGMRKRLSVARALINDPELVFFDEPTAGIDPILRQKMWGYFRQLADRGKTLFITTHYAGEAELCDQIALVADGKLIELGSPIELRRRALGGDLVDIVASQWEPSTLAEIARLPGVERVQLVSHDTLRVHVAEAASEMPRLLDALNERDVEVSSMTEQRPPFDDVFAELVRRHEGESAA
ncbi:MAG TPA: ABC transporter ATP-binding protein [Chloroflexota bacterium]|nr:ABC transporter ATP-binding protein [Chloroflexota bacterium]